MIYLSSLISVLSPSVVIRTCFLLLGMGKGRSSPQGTICPAFRQMGGLGGTELFLCLLFLNCLQLKIIHMPKWQILGWPDLFQKTDNITVEWKEKFMCFWTKTLGSLDLLSPLNRLLFIFLIPRLAFLFLHVSFCMSLLRDCSDQPEQISWVIFV